MGVSQSKAATWGAAPGRANAEALVGNGSLEKAQRRLFNAVGEFLFEHRLAPSPANYMLAHMMITRSSPDAVQALEAVTSDGLRLTQEEADRILSEAGGGQVPSVV